MEKYLIGNRLYEKADLPDLEKRLRAELNSGRRLRNILHFCRQEPLEKKY